MEKFNKKLVISVLIAVFTLGLGVINSPIANAVQAKVDLNTTEPFAILSGNP